MQDKPAPESPKVEKDVSRTASVDMKFEAPPPEPTPPRRAGAKTLTVRSIVRHGVSAQHPWGGATLTLSDGSTVFVDARAIEEAPWA